jgi:hypothetical protein
MHSMKAAKEKSECLFATERLLEEEVTHIKRLDCGDYF